MRTIALVNQKGGCGKTTTAINLSACLAERGRKVLLVDLDPQAHATLGLNVNPEEVEKGLYDVLVGSSTSRLGMDEIVQPISGNLFLAPSNVLLSASEQKLADVRGRERRLFDALSVMSTRYHYAIIDSPPNLGLLTFNTLRACQEAIIPVETNPELLTATAVDNSGLVTEGFDFFVGGTNKPGIIKVMALSDLNMGDGVERLPAGEHQVARIVFEAKESTIGRNVSLSVTNSVLAIDHERALNHQVVVKHAVPRKFALAQNYPNPFNPETEIRYTLPKDCRVTLEIFNVLGQRVATLVDEHQEAGDKSTTWDGRKERGQEAASGIYIYQLRAGETRATKKAVLLR